MKADAGEHPRISPLLAMSTQLRLIHDDGGPDIWVIVHGLAVLGDYDCDTLERQVHEAELRGSVYVLQWSASIVRRNALLAGDVRKIGAADQAGMSLARKLSRLRDAQSRPITLIGHSQGTLVIHSALGWLAERSRRVTRVLLMGGVVRADPELWEDVAPAVRQEIVNVHSSGDKWLLPLGRSIGRYPINSDYRKIRNLEITCGHFQYWPYLSKVLKWIWPRRRRSRKYHPTVETVCPCCKVKIITTANESLECPWCKVEGTYRISDDSFHYDIAPKKMRCRFCDSGTIWVQGSALYGCDGPGCRAWNDVRRIGSRVQFRIPR